MRTPGGSLCRALLLGVLLISLGGCGIFGGEEPEDAPAELVKFRPTLKIKKAWSGRVGDGAEFLRLALVPASDGAQIFGAAHDGRMAAFDAGKGKRKWLVKTELKLSAGPAYGDGLVVAGSSDGDVIAVEADTGDEAWRVQVASEVLAPPAVTPALVLVRTVDGKLIALDRGDGSEVWVAQQSVPRLSVRGTGSPVVSGDRVVCGFDNGRLAAYDIADGALAWDVLLAPPSGRTEVERLSDLNATVQVVDDDVYAASYQGSLSAVALESGQTLWSRDISTYSELAADFINLYVTGADGTLLAVSRRSGREMWQQEMLRYRDVSGPAAFANSIVVGDFEGYVHWFDATTGELQARVRAGSDRITSPPLVVGERIYVMSDSGRLYSFRDATPREATADAR